LAWLALIGSALGALQGPSVARAGQLQFGDAAFVTLWTRTDALVTLGKASRSYLWGPAPLTEAFYEPYNNKYGKRLVQYFDKTRMEINDPNGNRLGQYFVSNGLLVKEMMTGQLQLGDNLFQKLQPANIPVAGDADDTLGPTYKNLNEATSESYDLSGSTVVGVINRDGLGGFDPQMEKYSIVYAHYDETTHHNIASPFWDYLNLYGPVVVGDGNIVAGRLFDPIFYATGLPITDAYWAEVKVGGQVKDVLIQAFERRILTYTPSNPHAYKVEMGNVGQHYYHWRYGQ
jgi:hypothetical protein